MPSGCSFLRLLFSGFQQLKLFRPPKLYARTVHDAGLPPAVPIGAAAYSGAANTGLQGSLTQIRPPAKPLAVKGTIVFP